MRTKLAWVASIAVALTGCFEEESRQIGSGETPAAVNTAPTITGSPPASVLQGQGYEFTPAASDPDGDTMEFSIERKPAWASFDRSTGRLTGTPGAADAGNFTNIRISVTDGKATVALNDFAISVRQVAEGSATLSWSPPTQNNDGSALTNIAGYRIYFGRNRDNLTEVVVIDNPGLTRYVVENLTPARWFFRMTTLNTDGAESTRSQAVSKTIG